MRSLVCGVVVAAAVTLPAHAFLPPKANPRKTTDDDLRATVQRVVLDSGLVVLLSPDPRVNTVQVNLSLHAGSIYAPTDKSGFAHLVEHVMMEGPTPDTRYVRELESRGARHVNALTGLETMIFQISVPPEQVPYAVWVQADRLGHLPSLLDQVDLAAHRRIVLQERAENTVDRPFGLTDQAFFQSLFPRPHPLHDGVIGRVDELEQVTTDDVKRFVETYFVPANATLVLTGNFDPARALEDIRKSWTGLRPGKRATLPKAKVPAGTELRVTARERLSRQPRVTLAWRIEPGPYETMDRLAMGALLLEITTNGAFGTELEASLHRTGNEHIFRLDVTLPHQKPADSARMEADAFLRYLTQTPVAVDIMESVNLWYDRVMLETLDGVRGRAALLLRLEDEGLDPTHLERILAAHWRYDPGTIQSTARRYLGKSRLVLYSEPVRPREAQLDRWAKKRNQEIEEREADEGR